MFSSWMGLLNAVCLGIWFGNCRLEVEFFSHLVSHSLLGGGIYEGILRRKS